jgi:hypothetical protein
LFVIVLVCLSSCSLVCPCISSFISFAFVTFHLQSPLFGGKNDQFIVCTADDAVLPRKIVLERTV